jgi:hypothetical protein
VNAAHSTPGNAGNSLASPVASLLERAVASIRQPDPGPAAGTLGAFSLEAAAWLEETAEDTRHYLFHGLAGCGHEGPCAGWPGWWCDRCERPLCATASSCRCWARAAGVARAWPGEASDGQ